MNDNKKNSKDAGRFSLEFAFFCVVLAVIAAVLIYLSVYAYKIIETYEKSEEGAVDADISNAMPTVIIDAGHGGEDGGTEGKNGVKEKDLNLDIAFKLRDILKAYGMNVILTRSEDILLYDRNVDYKGHKKSLDLKARLDIAKSVPDSIFVSIHMNAYPSDKYSGLQVWYSKNDTGSKLLADTVQSLIRERLQNENNRKIKAADSSIYLLDRAVSPSVLVECGFLSNPAECEKLSDENYRRSVAFVISMAIMSYSANNGCK
ncbi:MAG: N-acetylmuramoyl-L-alanine amidase [Clostridia bacterium]|nr:N-acetylmuramoyl-L-alanine amidase [Clostridia bacterium]